MNANRRADLQRKLAVAPVEKPPAGLAAKIKSDIPKELRFSAERERARFTHSVRLSMAVAASVIVVIATAYLALQVTSQSSVEPASKRAVTATTSPAPVLQTPPAVVAAPPPPVAKVTRHRKERTLAQRPKRQEAPPVAFAPPPPAEAPAAAPMPAAAVAADRAATKSMEEAKSEMTRSPISGNVMGVAGGTVVPWKDASRETKIKILKEELAHGADPKEVARVAREAGLSEFADSIEKY